MSGLIGNFFRDERGSVILSSTITIIALAILIGYVANMGAETLEREKMQHAADAAAYSSAVVMARGMNTVCSLNHVMGELTAFCVILESLGGPEEKFPPCKEEVEMNRMLEGVCRLLSPHPDWPADRKAVETIIDKIATDHKEHTAGAACYDAELTLKYHILLCMSLKAKATLLIHISRIIPYVGQVIYAIATVVHGVMDALLIPLMAEYVVIRSYEALLPATHPIRAVIRTYRIPSLSTQQQQVAEMGLWKQERLLGSAIQATNDEIRERYDMQKIVTAPSDTLLPLSSIPQVKSLPLLPLLPVLVDPASEKMPTASRYLERLPSKPWVTGGTGTHPYSALPPLPWQGTDASDGLMADAFAMAEKIDSAISIIKPIVKMFDVATGLFKKKPKWVSRVKNYLRQIESLDSVENYKPPRYGYRNNPSVWSYPVAAFDDDKEKRSQWVRATYPVVDSIRSGLRVSLRKNVAISNMSTYMTAWSYRYTLSESFYLRTAEKRPYGRLNTLFSCGMPVIATSGPNAKGNEIWTIPVAGAKVVDEMFTVIAAVESPPHPPIATDVIFRRRGQERGNVAVAQAMFYAASGRFAHFPTGALVGKENATQPDTAWDTLQWKPKDDQVPPELIAPEWWNEHPSYGPNSWGITDLFSPLESLESAKIHLNWQAMLTPLSQSRLSRLSDEPDASDTMSRAARHAAGHTRIISH